MPTTGYQPTPVHPCQPARPERRDPWWAWPGLPVPTAGPGTCSVCHGPTGTPGSRCWCCRHVGRDLGTGPTTVVPMALYRPGDRLHHVLRGYKDAPSPSRRHLLQVQLAAMTELFFFSHGPCLSAAIGPVDALCVVPATHRRFAGSNVSPDRNPDPGPGQTAEPDTWSGATPRGPWPWPPSPLSKVLSMVPSLARLSNVPLVAAPGRSAPRHLSAPSAAYVVLGAVKRDARVLLMDDTWTTGAHIRSATSVLKRAGLTVAGVVVAGRAIEPSASPAVAQWWQEAMVQATVERRQRRIRADEGRLSDVSIRPCCLPRCRAVNP